MATAARAWGRPPLAFHRGKQHVGQGAEDLWPSHVALLRGQLVGPSGAQHTAGFAPTAEGRRQGGFQPLPLRHGHGFPTSPLLPPGLTASRAPGELQAAIYSQAAAVSEVVSWLRGAVPTQRRGCGL